MIAHVHDYKNLDQEKAKLFIEKIGRLNHTNYLMIDSQGDFHCVGILRKIWEQFKGCLGFKNHTEYFWVASHTAAFMDHSSWESNYMTEFVPRIQEFVARNIFRREVKYEKFERELHNSGFGQGPKNFLNEVFQTALKQSNPRLFFKQYISNIAKDNSDLKKKEKHIQRHLLDCLPSALFLTKEERLQEIRDIASNYHLVCFDKAGPTACLGNSAICPEGIKIWGKKFRCAEAAFQWKKCEMAGATEKELAKFFTCNGEEAIKIRNQLKHLKLHENWSEHQNDYMHQILKAKFAQNPDFNNILIATQNAHLLAHTNDKREGHWADANDGSGNNFLGKMLMSIRNNHPTFIETYCETDREYSQKANEGLTYQIH